MKKSNFDRLLKRYLAGNVTEEERIRLEAWLDAMKVNRGDEVELSLEEEEKLFRKIVEGKAHIREIQSLPETPREDAAGSISRLGAALVAIILVVFLGWYLGYRNSGNREFASTSAVEKINLEDGSLVWMKGSSRLKFRNENDARYTEFNGEALFEVAKDPNHPFIIQCGRVTLRVVGTSFTVKTGADTMALQVLTGTVHVMWPDNPGIDVTAHQKLVIGKGIFLKDSLADHEVVGAVAGTEYDLALSNVSLREVTNRLEKKFDVVIEITETSASACRITADLTDMSLDNALKILTEVLDVNYTINDKHVTIDGQGCNKRNH